MRLIDADELIHRLLNTKIVAANLFQYANAVTNIICDAPTIEATPTVDAVEVVRCRECKHWGDEDGKLQSSDGVLFARCKIHNYLLDGRHTGWCPTENDFCSYGERKEGADNG